jgi:hypothetical protein|tara:strand:- start:33 stop:608 length:576 start_codon:yes stop_codon:yes gene_type:complete
MKSRDFRKLNESITFAVSKEIPDEVHGTVNDLSHFGKRKDVECWYCDGTGKEKHYNQIPCEVCDGTGTELNKWIPSSPELSISNPNGYLIMDMLGIESKSSGTIKNANLPALMRKLIQLKNSDRSQYAEPGSQSGGKIGTYKDQAGMDTIGRKGPMMYNMGTTDDQVTAYVDQLIKIIKFAQDNDADFGWG